MHLLGAPVLLKGSQPFAELCTSEVAHAAMQQRSWKAVLQEQSAPVSFEQSASKLVLHARTNEDRPGPVSPETSTDGTSSQKPLTSDGSESLLARLQQAEQSLAEKDQRIEALEACTRQLAERLALAEGLAKPKDCKDPSTPTSTRSTSDSTAWSGDQPVLPRNFTMESLVSDESYATYAPQTSVAAKSPRKPTKPSYVRGTKVSDEYATQADVDAVCHRCEQLLKSVTSAVENNEPLASKRKQQKSSVPTLRRLKGGKQITASW